MFDVRPTFPVAIYSDGELPEAVSGNFTVGEAGENQLGEQRVPIWDELQQQPESNDVGQWFVKTDIGAWH